MTSPEPPSEPIGDAEWAELVRDIFEAIEIHVGRLGVDEPGGAKSGRAGEAWASTARALSALTLCAGRLRNIQQDCQGQRDEEEKPGGKRTAEDLRKEIERRLDQLRKEGDSDAPPDPSGDG